MRYAMTAFPRSGNIIYIFVQYIFILVICIYYFLFIIQSKERTLNKISTGTLQYWGFSIVLNYPSRKI